MSMYFEEARRFGKLLMTSEQAVNLANANAALENDEAAKKKMRFYTEYQAGIRDGMNRGSLREAEVQAAQTRLKDMVSDMRMDPVIGALLKAEAEFNAFMNQVFGILRMTVGANESVGGGCGCSGENAACGGCK